MSANEMAVASATIECMAFRTMSAISRADSVVADATYVRFADLTPP